MLIILHLTVMFMIQSLSQNVALINDPEDPRKFYPRFNVEDTTSFMDLDQHRYLMRFSSSHYLMSDLINCSDIFKVNTSVYLSSF